MKKYVSFYDFCDSFSESYRHNFTYEGKRALFDYLENLEEELGEEIELDTIALCCEYTEYEDFKDIKSNYNNIESLEDLENHTTVIKVDNTDRFIIADF